MDRSISSISEATRRDSTMLSGILTGQAAGLIMAVAMMAVFTLFLHKGPLYPVQVIGSTLVGETALHGFNLKALLAAARLPASAEPLGPVPAGDGAERLLLRVPRADGTALAAALHAAAAVRSARKAPDPVRVQLDPLELF